MRGVVSSSQSVGFVGTMWRLPHGPKGTVLHALRAESLLKQVVELIPVSTNTGPQVCLDAISLDYRYVADHCTAGVITVRDLQSGDMATIQPPDDVSGFKLLGSARFSPDGKKVAYALAVGNPDSEQSWVAIGERSGGGSKTILVGSTGSYYTIAGWLDDQTILVASHPQMLRGFFPDPALKPLFDRWEKDMVEIMDEVREAK